MYCPVCASEDATISRISIDATRLGLPSGTLIGVEQTSCEECGETSISIPAHGAVVKEYRKNLASVGRPLSAAEFAYLRRSLGLSGRAYAELLQVSNVTISRIENGTDVPALQDNLIRAVTLLDIVSLEGLKQFTSRVSESVAIDVMAVERSLPRDITDGWQELPKEATVPMSNVVSFPRAQPRQIESIEFEAEDSYEFMQVASCH